MLPLPNLDDKTFEQILEEAKRLIPIYAPQWTDHNHHDPGITFLELFAWLSEMQQYHLNKIPEKNELKFLKLLGCPPRDREQAVTCAVLSGPDRKFKLLKGTKLSAGEVMFETKEAMTCLPVEISRIIVQTDRDFIDNTLTNQYPGVYYYAFGREAKKDNQLFIGFDRELPAAEEIRINFSFADDYPICLGELSEGKAEIYPSAELSFKYFGKSSGKSGWHDIDVIRDETFCFTHNGFITFKLNSGMKPVRISADDRERYWIRISVHREGFELKPKIDKLEMNAVKVVQQDTLSEVTELSSSGEPCQMFELDGYIDFYGFNSIQVKDPEGNWIYWTCVDKLEEAGPQDKVFSILRNEEEKKLVLRFGDGTGGRIPDRSEGGIRVISHLPQFGSFRLIGRSNGLSSQSFDIGIEKILKEDFMLQISRKINGEEVWQDWTRVGDFDASGPADMHYVLDDSGGRIVFGDNENGMVPPVSPNENICILSCRTGGGKEGNIKENSISRIIIPDQEIETIRVTNPYAAAGGNDGETIGQAKARILKELKHPYRAVTSGDYERIALGTPGIRVAKARAIPLYEPGMQGYPQNKAEGKVTVVVLPYTEDVKPMPGEGFLRTVKEHLDRHRLITTEIFVIPPEYIKVSVIATIIVESGKIADSGTIVKVLNKLLNPIDSSGWDFGRTIHKSDIYEAINEIKGVQYIRDLWINVEGGRTRKTITGDVEIPAYGLVYSGEHEIEVIDKMDI
ncbi:MAG TPA: putative baseplate assembly protein [Clostridia bacterium]|nr:putative baseplate assembly protein [Clostridia bacterium]